MATKAELVSRSVEPSKKCNGTFALQKRLLTNVRMQVVHYEGDFLDDEKDSF